MTHGKRTLVFPNVSGSNLEGKSRRLPSDFEGDLNIVARATESVQSSGETKIVSQKQKFRSCRTSFKKICPSKKEVVVV
jgi:hypothetical protein